MNTLQFIKHRYDLRKGKKHAGHHQEDTGTGAPPPPPSGVDISTIAIILDGEVQEVIRAEMRMTALLLSEPKFVAVDMDMHPRPTIGWKYENGKFVAPAVQIDESQIITSGGAE